jgi:hypothetical protein
MRNEGKKKVKARKNGSRLLATLGVAREGNGVRRGIRIKIMIMNDLTHLLRTEAGQAFAMICRHGGLDGYLRLFPGFPILGYSRNFEIFGYSKIFEEFRGLGKKMAGRFSGNVCSSIARVRRNSLKKTLLAFQGAAIISESAIF